MEPPIYLEKRYFTSQYTVFSWGIEVRNIRIHRDTTGGGSKCRESNLSQPTVARTAGSYLTGLLAFLGVTNVEVVRAEGVASGPDAKDAAVARALEDIAAIAA
jgi:hypothetical protein